MSWQAQTWAVEMGKRYELDPNHRWMLTILANYADPEATTSSPASPLSWPTPALERTQSDATSST